MNARNSLKSLAVSSDSESEVEPFITQTKAASVAVLQLSFGKTILNLHLRVQTTVKQLTISIIAPTMLQPTCMFTDKEDSRRVITTRKFSRGMAVEIDEPTTKKIRECGAKETQLTLILVIIVPCLTFPINICYLRRYVEIRLLSFSHFTTHIKQGDPFVKFSICVSE